MVRLCKHQPHPREQFLTRTHTPCTRYVLSTTHLHEFKSADKGQAPIMSLYLPEQKLGSHSSGEGSSNKFILKGRQTGAMHRGHTWVFRAESHDTMMAWYEDIKALTEKTAEERTHFVRTHSRSLSQSSRRSASSDGLVDDDDDEEPFSAGSQIDVNPGPKQDAAPRRTQQPGGRFPSDIQVNAQRGLQAHRSTSSLSSGARERALSDTRTGAAATGAVAAGAAGLGAAAYSQQDEPSDAAVANQEARQDGVNPYTGEPMQHPPRQLTDYHQSGQAFVAPGPAPAPEEYRDQQHDGVVGHGENYTAQTAPGDGYAKSPQPQASGFDQAADQQHQPKPTASAIPAMWSQGHNVDPNHQGRGGSIAYAPSGEGSVVSGGDVPVRPTDGSTRQDSTNAITNHMPGGYPRTNVA